ncbi:MAG: hypothetical protein AUI17_08075 [Acidobacteriales bacterium 13_2_20CM_2_55_5]|nr:MAG: hypothetical protein AUI17_08075 [Acidobacteriales bacterium 13_2_20CM_2_55_5]
MADDIFSTDDAPSAEKGRLPENDRTPPSAAAMLVDQMCGARKPSCDDVLVLRAADDEREVTAS